MPQVQEKQIRTNIRWLKSELKLRRQEARPLPASVVRAYETAVSSQYALLEKLPNR